ncbi:hypothetical protein DEJ49_29165 [Streptomyces venezuelae]|uniref:PPM-type phosphatase domain-containing protein n=1 Tax=Streptomyces venezuelae TaxID=54571 RepID=A0A5P2CNV3_STRVZ|nr:protein phosphatase 2C domain-containing protein [Streptomyces venezuelae]QES44525.1 hypothetical protein DEJ49_29165 [Streptomyces venezuelae]
MSQQGDRPSGRDDDWWGQLYDDAAPDTGPSSTPDTLDDRYASASNALQPPVPPQRPPTDPFSTDPSDAHPGPRDDNTPPAVPGEPGPPGPFAAPGPRGAGAPPDVAGRPGRPGPFAAHDPRDDTDPPDAAGPPYDPSAGRTPAGRPEPPASPAPEEPAASRPPRTPPTFTAPAPWAPPAVSGGPSTFPAGERGGGGEGVGYSGASTEGPRAGAAGSRPPGVHGASPRPPGAHGVSPRSADDGVPYVGDGPPTYEAEPSALPAADPDDLGELVADTVLDGARYGASTLRAASVRGDSARYRGEPRRDALLTARFGSGEDALVLVAMATGARATPGAHRAAAEACDWIGRAVGRSHARLAEDIRAARRGDLKSGLHRLTDRSLGKLRAHAADLGMEPDEYAASLRCLLLPADPSCRTRVFFGVGAGGLFRLRDGAWQDIEPRVAEATGEGVVGFGSPPPPGQPEQAEESDRLTMALGITTPPSPYEPAPEPPRDPFRFRASIARPGDTLVLCSEGLAEPLRGEPELAEHLTRRWEKGGPPGLAAFLADVQVRVKGYADDRTAAAVWEA